MAKSTKHVDTLGSFDNFRAPWQSEAGEDAEIDKSKLARLIYNVRLDVARAKDALEDAKAAQAQAETERDEAKEQAADGSGAEAQKKIDTLTKERDAAQAKVDKFEADAAEAELRKEVLGDFAEKNPKAAKYVTGTTKEELEASLEEVKADWGISEDDEDDEDKDDEPVVSTRPRSRSLKNPIDRQNGKGGDKEIDFEKVAEDAIAGGGVRF